MKIHYTVSSSIKKAPYCQMFNWRRKQQNFQTTTALPNNSGLPNNFLLCPKNRFDFQLVHFVDEHHRSWGSIYVRNEPFSSPAQGTPEPPKVEEIARQICSELYLCFGKRHLVVSPLLEKSSREQVSAILRPYFPASQKEESRTYGDLPGSIRNMVEPHEWDNKNISEQRDYAVDMVDFLEREIGNFRRNAAAATPASTARTDGWVSVEERLPEDSELVLLFQRDGIASVTTFGVRDKGKWLDYNDTTDDYPNEIRKITHWQPLPAAPGSVPQAEPPNGQGWDEEHFGSVCSDYRHLAIERHKALGHEGEFERCVYEKCQRRNSATFGPAPPTGDAPHKEKP